MRPLSIALALLVLLAERAAHAQTAVCPPTVELGANIPPRVAQRLRRALDHAVDGLPPTAPCVASHARLDWNERELTVHIALDDGRIAVRSLESLEDVLPTLLSVLAVPALDPAPPAAPPPPAAPATSAAPPVAPLAAPPVSPVLLIAPPVDSSAAWSLLVSMSVGASVQQGGSARGRWSAEVGAATRGLALSARSSMAYAFDRGERPNRLGGFDDDARDHRTESSVVLSGRARLGGGRLRGEVGGFGGIAHDAGDEPDRWVPRFGLEAALSWRFTRSLATFVRAEGFLDIGGDRGPGLALTIGATWEPQR